MLKSNPTQDTVTRNMGEGEGESEKVSDGDHAFCEVAGVRMLRKSSCPGPL